MATKADIDAWVGNDPLRQRAREWADRVNAATGLSGGWRLQAMSLRSRRRFPASASADGSSPDPGELVASDGSPVYSDLQPSASGKCPDLPARVRRFVSGCPWPILEQVVRYLYASAPYEGIVFNGVKSDRVYRPTLTQWTRDAQTQVGADATYTLVQDLVEVSECRDEELVQTGESCLQVESTTFRWDEPYVELPEALGPCVQGETSSVQAVRRNEDGTFDYQLVKTTARTRHVPAHAVACDAAHSASEERWENLYGSPGAWEARDACGDVPLSGLPDSSCESLSAGARTSWDVQLNRDCTYSVSRRVVRANRVASSWTDGTACQEASHEEVRGDVRAPRLPRPSAGQRVDARVQVEDDGSYTWSRTVREAPPEDEVRWGDGSPCRPREVLHATDVRSKAAALAYVPERVAGRVVDAQVSRNEDCTWDVRVSAVESPAQDSVSWTDGSPCRPREHVRAMNVPEKAAAVGLVHARASRYVVDAQVSRNEDCTWDVVSSRTKAPAAWSSSWTDGSLASPVSRRVWQSQSSVPSAAVARPGRRETVSASLRRNDDCTYDASRETRTRAPGAAVWHEGSACRPVETTARWAQDTWTKDRPGPGETVSMSVQRNDDGTYDERRSVTRRSGVPDAEWTEGSPCRPVRVTQGWDRDSVPDVSVAAGETVSVSVQRNDDCTYDFRKSVRTRSAAPDIRWDDGSPGVSVTSHVVSEGAYAPPSVDMEPGAVTRASVRRDDDCTYSSEVSVTRTAPSGRAWTEGTGCRPVATRAWWGLPDVPAELSSPPAAGHEVSASVQRNADGTYDAVVRDRSPEMGNASSWEHGSVMQTVTSTAYSAQSEVPKVPPPAPGTTVSASFSRSSDCTYSGRVDVAESVPSSGVMYRGGTGCVPTTTVLYDHVRSIPPVSPGGLVSVSSRFSRESDGTYSGSVSTTDYSGASGVLFNDTWESVEQTPDHIYTYETTLVIFRHMSSLPALPRKARLDVSVRLEDDCTISGSVTATRLKSWERNGGGSSGGLATGSFNRTEHAVIGGVVFKRELHYTTTVFEGSGNASASTLSGYDNVVGWGRGVMGIKCTNPGAPWFPA